LLRSFSAHTTSVRSKFVCGSMCIGGGMGAAALFEAR
jgi:hypothetical protein